MPNKMLLKRLDPRTGEEMAAVTLEGFSTNTTEMAVGAGSVWVCSGDYYPEPVGRRQPGDVVLRIDPETNRVVDRIPVDSPTGLAFGRGSVWVTSAGHGTLSRIDPRTGEVAAKIEVGRGAVDIAVDESSGEVWVAGIYLAEDYSGDSSQGNSEHNKLSRVDPETNRVVAEIPIAAHARYGGAYSVAVGEGAVWAQSEDGRLFKVDPATDEVVAEVPLGEYSSHLTVHGGAVWATVQVSAGTRLVRVDPRTGRVVASEELGSGGRVGYGRLVAGGGYVWFGSGEGLARVSP
jgi:streptogramin lyase